MISQWLNKYSRFKQIETYTDTNNNVLLNEREPLDEPTEGQYFPHVVSEDETCFSLASYYYYDLSKRPAGLWWAIAEANNIVDPTQKLTPGKAIKIPDFSMIEDYLGYKKSVFV